jgi:hypothetical protein
LGYLDSPNLYQFVNRDPVNFLDPLGRDTFIVHHSEGVDIFISVEFPEWGITGSQSASWALSRFKGAVEQTWGSIKGLSTPVAFHVLVRISGKVEGGDCDASTWGEDSLSKYYWRICWSGPDTTAGREEITPEIGKLLMRSSIFTIGHEVGHLLGLRDYYWEAPIKVGEKTIWATGPNTVTFGEYRASGAMGTVGGPFLREDLEEVIDPAISKFELGSDFQKKIHHFYMPGDLPALKMLFNEIATAAGESNWEDRLTTPLPPGNPGKNPARLRGWVAENFRQLLDRAR